MTTINGHDLYQMFNYGAYFVNKERKQLNDINVFPVPDGDTGDNLLQTLKSIVLESRQTNHFSEALNEIGEAALRGARGNSGVIFAQFVNGLELPEKQLEVATIDDFQKMVETSYQYTKSALSNPVEGTMLTMIDAWAQSLKKHTKAFKDLKDIFKASLETLEEALLNTKQMLDALKDKDVVDSGAFGFLLFVKGVVSYYHDEPLDVIEYEKIELAHEHHFDQDIVFRYCTEGLVSYETFDQNALEKALKPLGDSIVIAKSKSHFRVHIHTNTPEIVFQTLNAFGQVESQKVDDMQLEVHLKNSDKKRVLVTDSIADIDPQFIDDHNIVVIPLSITIDDTVYLDKVSMNNQILFDNLGTFKAYPKTATPSVKMISDLFQKLLLKFEEVIVITVSSGLSLTHEVIKNEALKFEKQGHHIHVVDAMTNSVTEGLLVKYAVDMMAKGIKTKDLIHALETERQKTEILVCLETFKYATMSGRLPKAVGQVGMALKLRPIMTVKNGKGHAYGMSFSQKGITKKIKKTVLKDMQEKGIKNYAIVHCLNPELAQSYAKTFEEMIGFKPAYITDISAATAIHSGVGSVAIGYIKEKV